MKEQSTSKQSTTKGFAILSTAGMIVKVMSLLYIPFLRRIITDEGYGVYAAAYSVYVFVFVITNSGIPVAISKLISELTAVKNYKDAIKSFKIARTMLLCLGIVMSILTLLLAKPLAKAVHYDEAYLSILALAPSILFTSIASAYRGYFQGWGNMTPTAVSQVIEQLINTIFTLVCAHILIKYGLEAGCAGGTIGTSLGAFCSAIYLVVFYERHKKIKVIKETKIVHMKRHSAKYLAKKIIHYGIPITLSIGMAYAGNLVDTANTKARLLAGGIPWTNANILNGYLFKYQQLLNVPISIISSLAVAILPAIAGAAAVNDRISVREKVRYAFRLCFLIAIPSAMGLAILSGPIFSMLGFGKGSFLMQYGSIVLVLMGVMQIQTTILQSIGKLYTATIYSFIGIVFKILTNYFLIAIPSVNILGAIVGSIVGYLIPIILNHMVLKKALRVKFSLLEQAIKPIIAAIFMGIAVWGTYSVIEVFLSVIAKGYIMNSILTIISIIIGMYVYMFALILTGGLGKEDFRYIPSKVMRFIPNALMQKMQ